MAGFNNLFWGFILTQFDFRVEGLNMLPDTMGYLIIYHGLEQLMEHNKHFKTARIIALPLVFLSIFDLFTVNQLAHDIKAWVFLTGGIVTGVVDLLLVYHICIGIAELALASRHDDLEIPAYKRWRYYLYAKICYLILTPVMIMGPRWTGILLLPLFITVIISAILLLKLISRAREAFSSGV